MARARTKAAAPRSARLSLLKEVTELVAKAKSLNLRNTVYLLNMAKLDLQARIYKITDTEMEAFITATRSPDPE